MNKVYEDDVGTLKLEEYQGDLFIHCDIKRWSRDAVEHCMIVWSELLLQLREKGYNYLFAYIDESNEKLIKFANLFGMLPTERKNVYMVKTWDCQ